MVREVVEVEVVALVRLKFPVVRAVQMAAHSVAQIATQIDVSMAVLIAVYLVVQMAAL